MINTTTWWLCVVCAQEEEARQIALLEEAMRASPSLVSAFSDQLQRDNMSVRSFRGGGGGGHEPRRSFSTMDNRSHLVHSTSANVCFVQTERSRSNNVCHNTYDEQLLFMHSATR